MNKTIFETLEHTIQEAIVKIDSLKNRNKILLEEKKQLQNQLAERDRRIKGLQKTILDLKKNSNEDQIQQYQEKEDKLRKRIQMMLSRIDEMNLTV